MIIVLHKIIQTIKNFQVRPPTPKGGVDRNNCEFLSLPQAYSPFGGRGANLRNFRILNFLFLHKRHLPFDKKGRYLIAPLFIVLLLILLNGCGKENPVPAYLHIPSFSFSAKNTEGSSSQKITDAWVYVDGQINGVFALPATLPVIELGQHEISVFPGIRNNGTRSNPVIYPLYNSFKIKMDLKAGKIDTIRPATTYISNAEFKIMENFENGNIFRVDRDNNSALKFNILDGFEGKSGQIVLTKANPIMEKASIIRTQLSESAENIYLELNYKTEAALSVGLVGSDANNTNGIATYKIVLFPNKEWNKTYINLTNEAKDLKKVDFQITFQSLLPDSLSTATIWIDNVKLIQK